MRFYTQERLGPTQSLNPAGFLIIQDTPVARTGEQDYHVSEIRGDDGQPLLPDDNGMIRVYRSPDEVFKPESLASYSAAPLCIDHPDENITPANWRTLAIGEVMHAHRGEGMLDDLVIADLVVKCPDAIAAIRAGDIRELSVGYNARYEQTEPGKATQHDIIVNHNAFVPAGRCGMRCAIGDRLPEPPPPPPSSVLDQALPAKDRRGTRMAKRNWIDRLLSRVADAESEEEKEKAAKEAKEKIEDRIAADAEEAEEEREKKEKEDKSEDRRWKDQESTNAEIHQALGAISEKLERLTAAEEAEVEMEDKATGDKTRFIMRRGDAIAKAKDQGGEMPVPETNPEMMGETDLPGTSPGDRKRIGDSAAMEPLWQETIAMAEIVSPGIRLPTFDAKHEVTLTAKRLCALRRHALDSAWATDDGKALITEVVGLDAAGLKGISCDAIKMAFKGVAQARRQANNDRATAAARNANGGGRDTKPPGPVGLADIQKMNTDFYASRGVGKRA